ncbi:InlB B-repeat-containing protein [Gehongia tenuis]|uniref:LPXTG cell wall anchor domain-containing protein n=1 Tax=Gehongia tenuis TaxID=2763655 RepID=A0A926D2T4_9FIRM|nr:NosD domain-containing protein [Gehongia tenuis]MBC8530476.1 LPXTG cell wall anchor domain-containing protein [Gehongia tenuis]
MQELTGQAGKTYIVEGQTFVLKDVVILGGGVTEIRGSVGNDANDTALVAGGDVKVTVAGDVDSTSYGVDTHDNAEVIVKGDVSAENGDGVYTEGNSKVTVEGNVASENGDGVNTFDNSHVVVDGNVTAEHQGVNADDDSVVTVGGNVTSKEDNGIQADGQAQVTVDGNVTGGSAPYPSADPNSKEGYAAIDANDNSSVTVGGDATGGDAYGDETSAGNGVDADDDAKVMVEGNVTGGSGKLPEDKLNEVGAYSDSGVGVNADDNAEVTVGGNVAAGNAEGLYAYGGEGVYAESNSKVTVGGDVTGGNVTADPNGDPEDDIGYAGDGVRMESTAQVNVGGNVNGGNSNNKYLAAGNGVAVVLMQPTDIDDPQAEPLERGSVKVEGVVEGGSAPEGGASGASLFYLAYYLDGMEYMPGQGLEELRKQFAIDPEMDRQNQVDVVREIIGTNWDLAGMLASINYGMNDSDEEAEAAMAKALSTYLQNLIDRLGISVDIPDNATMSDLNDVSNDIEAALMVLTGTDLDEAVTEGIACVNEVNLESAISDAQNLVNALTADPEKTLAPDVTVWQLSSENGGMVNSSFGAKAVEMLFKNVNYIVRVEAPANGTLSANAGTAKAGETVIVTPAANEGYRVKNIYVSGTAISAVNGVYSFVMPEGGGVSLSAEFEKISEEPASSQESGNPKTGHDSAAPFLWAALAAVLAAGGVLAAKGRRTER